MDEVYIKMDGQTWEIPPTNRYVSDSDSPLSLLSSPSPTMRSPTMPSSIISPSPNGSQNRMMSMMLSTSAYSQDSLQLPYPTNKQQYNIVNDDDGEEAEYRSVMFHEHIIASNDSISCVRPQNVSIKWSSLANTTTDTILTTDDKEEEEEDNSATTSDSSSSTEDTPAPTDSFSNSDNKSSLSTTNHSIKIIISRKKEEIKVEPPVQETCDLVMEQEGEVVGEVVEDTTVEDEEGEQTVVEGEETVLEEDQVNVVEEEEECSAVEETEALSSQEDEDEEEQEHVLPMTIREAATLALPPPPVSTPTTSKKRKYTKSIDIKIDNAKKKRKVAIVPTATVSNNRIVVNKNSNNKKKKKRTVTSYDTQTSRYLKSVFFEVYSKQSKLTKAQRAQVQEKTGLPSRNITYWFSNHKRRFQDTLKVYRKIVDNSNGTIKNYDDFIQYRRNHDLPDQVTQEEILDLDNDEENN